MTIYIILGKLKDPDQSDFVEVLVAKTFLSDAEKFCKEQIEKKDNPYSEVSWQKTELETKQMKECLDCNNYKGCKIEAAFTRFVELLYVRDEVNISALKSCLAKNCIKWDGK